MCARGKTTRKQDQQLELKLTHAQAFHYCAGEEGRRLKATQLFNHLYEACNILRVPINQDEFKAYVIPILFLKRIFDCYDEETAAAKAALKESLAAITAAQKALMNGAFPKEAMEALC